MKKRILAFLLAVSIAVSMLVLPASAAGNANTAVQLSITLNAMDSSQQAALNAVVTRGALARMLVSRPKALLLDELPCDDWDARFAPENILTEKGILR